MSCVRHDENSCHRRISLSVPGAVGRGGVIGWNRRRSGFAVQHLDVVVVERQITAARVDFVQRIAIGSKHERWIHGRMHRTHRRVVVARSSWAGRVPRQRQCGCRWRALGGVAQRPHVRARAGHKTQGRAAADDDPGDGHDRSRRQGGRQEDPVEAEPKEGETRVEGVRKELTSGLPLDEQRRRRWAAGGKQPGHSHQDADDGQDDDVVADLGAADAGAVLVRPAECHGPVDGQRAEGGGVQSVSRGPKGHEGGTQCRRSLLLFAGPEPGGFHEGGGAEAKGDQGAAELAHQ